MERALELGVPGVEIDVCSLRDGTLVAAHDDWILSGGRRVPLCQLSLTDLHRVSASQFLTIDTALELVRDADTLLCLDWKGAGDVTLIGRSVWRHGLTARTIVSAATPTAVAGLKDRYPRLAAGLSLPQGGEHSRQPGRVTDGIVGAVGCCGADAVMLQHQLADRAVVAALRRLSMAVFLWTAADRETFESLWDRSPDGIMSDVVEEHSGARTTPQ